MWERVAMSVGRARGMGNSGGQPNGWMKQDQSSLQQEEKVRDGYRCLSFAPVSLSEEE